MTNSAKLRIAKQMMLISAALIAASSGAVAGFDKKTFKKPKEAELRTKLSAEQFEVTQHEHTESAFHNAYYDEHRAGIYVDIVSGEPLFSSFDKYDSGTGWPSFTKPLDAASLKSRKDKSLFATRTEIHSEAAKSHLGHVFDDGPKPLGKRYCMNSAALRFTPVADLKKEGYQQLLSLFAENKK